MSVKYKANTATIQTKDTKGIEYAENYSLATIRQAPKISRWEDESSADPRGDEGLRRYKLPQGDVGDHQDECVELEQKINKHHH